MYLAPVRFGGQQGEPGIQPCSESHFQHVRFGDVRGSKSHFDEDVLRLGARPFHGMVMFVHVRNEQGRASVCCLLNDVFHTKKTLVFESAHPNLVVRRVAIDQNAVVVRVDLHFLAVHLVVTPGLRFYD